MHTVTPTVREMFSKHHRRLESLFEDVTAALREGAREEARRLWTLLDNELTAHMLLEEQELFPRFTAFDAATARTLKAEHERFRGLLLELGTSVDLHLLTAPIASQFFDDLRQHAAREDELLYQWADRQVEREPLLAKLRRIARS